MGTTISTFIRETFSPPAPVRLEHVDLFFEEFPDFEHDPHKHPSTEFKRLSKQKGWDFHKDKKAREARRKFGAGLVRQFNRTYGRDENNLESWKELCRALEYDPIPDTLQECRELVMNTHVNLIDLLATKNTGQRVRKFANEVVLSEYTLQQDKVFPRDNIEAGSLLQHLLRHIFHPSL